MPTPARRLAFRILGELERDGPTLGDRLAAPDVAALDTRERAFLHELLLGTLRRRGEMDHALAARLDRPLTRLEAPVLTALRLGAYQVLRLRVPDRAAVSESVELARSAAPRAAGFVNAVLRALARDGPPPLPDPAKDPRAWLTTGGSLPPWLAERWMARLGAARAVERARALLDPPPVFFRANPRVPDALDRVRAAGLEPREAPVPGAWQASASLPPELLEQGTVYAQDLGSQMAGRLAATPGRVLDACAAPGGKATLIADAGGAAVRVVAGEASLERARRLAALAARWGSPNLRVVAADALAPPFAALFDTVLLDAPCSGLGTIGRHPDIRWRAREDDLQRHAGRQREMLASVARHVRPGGRLVYSTCSSEPEENEQVVASFLASHPRLRLEPLPEWARRFAEGAFAVTTPERDGADAFFAAVMTPGPAGG
jgi:16S rRNA (cytosine967-C5)-methyltransferase